MNTFVSLCLIGGFSLGPLCYAQHMDNDAKKKIIKDLDNLLLLNRSAETKVINAAISKLSSAGRDPAGAYDLLIQSKKVLMEAEKEKDRSQGKSAKLASNSLKDWMDREAKKYQDKNARKGLMLQYQWGVLVLKARLKENMMKATSAGSVEEETLDVTEFQKPAMDLLNAYLSACADPDFVDPSSSSFKNNNGSGGRAGARIAEQSVLNTEVGEALGIGSMSSKAFPDSMKNRDEIFEKLFFSGYRKTRNLAALRTAWGKRIAMEIALGKVNHAVSSGKKSGMQGRIASASEEAFDEQDSSVIDRLRWRCEMDCFELGDQANATRNMMALIKATVDPVRREQGIRLLRDRLIQSMKSMIPGASGEAVASGANAAAPAPSMPQPPRRKVPPTTVTTSRPMDDPGAVGTDAPKPSKPPAAPSDDFFEDA